MEMDESALSAAREALADLEAIIDDARRRGDWVWVERLERAGDGLVVALTGSEASVRPMTPQEKKDFRERLFNSAAGRARRVP